MHALRNAPVAASVQRPMEIPIIIQGPEAENSSQQPSTASPKESVAGSGTSSGTAKRPEVDVVDMSATARQPSRFMTESFQRSMQRNQEPPTFGAAG